MKLVENWGEVLTKAWSVRFTILAALLSGAEVALPIVQSRLLEAQVIPQGAFALTAAIISGGALVARVIAQSEIKK